MRLLLQVVSCWSTSAILKIGKRDFLAGTRPRVYWSDPGGTVTGVAILTINGAGPVRVMPLDPSQLSSERL